MRRNSESKMNEKETKKMLEGLEALILWLDADFDDEPEKFVLLYKRLYEHYQQLLNEGKHYEPKF